MTNRQPPLPLTDENQRLVNLYLLQTLQAYGQKGMEGIFAALDSSMKKDGEDDILTYEGMRKAIKRDLNKLTDLAKKPKELRKWLKTRKTSKMLQIRITKNQFLLNNTLNLLGIQFEDLFDRENLPGEADKTPAANDFSIKDDDARETMKLLQEINSKLDKVIFQQTGNRLRNTYFQKYRNLLLYILFAKNILLELCDDPEKSGFSFRKKNNSDEENKRTPQEIYAYDFSFLLISIRYIHKKSEMHKLFDKLQETTSNDFGTGRMITPLFMAGIFIQLFIYFIISGNKNNKQIFKISEGDMLDRLIYSNYDNNKVLEKLKVSCKKTMGIIKHILAIKIVPTEDLCIKYETLFVRFFSNTCNLFGEQVPVWYNIAFTNFTRKDIEEKIKKIFEPGYLFSFSIKKEQLDYLDKYVEEIEEAQLDLENYYEGNVDVDVDVDANEIKTTRKQIAPVGRLPERSD